MSARRSPRRSRCPRRPASAGSGLGGPARRPARGRDGRAAPRRATTPGARLPGSRGSLPRANAGARPRVPCRAPRRRRSLRSPGGPSRPAGDQTEERLAIPPTTATARAMTKTRKRNFEITIPPPIATTRSSKSRSSNILIHLLSGTTFSGTTFSGTTFSGTTFSGTTFSGTTIGLVPGADRPETRPPSGACVRAARGVASRKPGARLIGPARRRFGVRAEPEAAPGLRRPARSPARSGFAPAAWRGRGPGRPARAPTRGRPARARAWRGRRSG